MSQQSGGYGWWLAEDDLWYPPDRHPDPNYVAQFDAAPTPPEPMHPIEPTDHQGPPIGTTRPVASQPTSAWGQGVPTYQPTASYHAGPASGASGRGGNSGPRVALLVLSLIIVIGGVITLAYFGLRGSDDSETRTATADDSQTSAAVDDSPHNQPLDGVSYDLDTGIEHLPDNLSRHDLQAYMREIRDRSLAVGDDFCAFYRIVAHSLTEAAQQILMPAGGTAFDGESFIVFNEVSIDIRERAWFFSRGETERANIRRLIELMEILQADHNLVYAYAAPDLVDAPVSEVPEIQRRSREVWEEIAKVELQMMPRLEIDGRFENEC